MPITAHKSVFFRRLAPLQRLPYLLAPLLALAAGFMRTQDTHTTDAVSAAYTAQVQPLTQRLCITCHGGAQPAGGVDLSADRDLAAVRRDAALWQRALTQIQDRMMPPQSAPQPSAEQRALLVTWLTKNIASAAKPADLDPGRVLIHRLSRTEYNNTIRDLCGVDTRPADRFPADGGGGGGFDNDADTLFVPPILMERYLGAAGEVLGATKPGRLLVASPGKRLSARSAARQSIAHFAMRAFREPVDPGEVDRLMSLYDAAARRGASYEQAVKSALKAVLVSPEFLFRVEADRPTSKPYPLDDYELASRLSYFLWASMPDDTLFALAAQHRLRRPDVLEQQVRRMIHDPKAHSFAESFAAQWLRVRDLYTTAQPDPGRFPDYTPALRDSMYREPVEFFYALLRDDASLLNLIDADYTYLNADLARHYGITGVTGPEMRRVGLADRRRGGVETMAGVLTLTSYPQRTSPVLRGKWVLSELLGAPVPPPPPNAGGLPADDAPQAGLTFRQRLEKHRSRPECASCHSRMDPIGFGLENFDATGRWRDEIGGKPVDASGVLADGETFTGPVALKQHLLKQKDDFLLNLSEKMLAYALGRGLEPYDMPAAHRIADAVKREDYRSETLLIEIVKSYPFQYRKNVEQVASAR